MEVTQLDQVEWRIYVSYSVSIILLIAMCRMFLRKNVLRTMSAASRIAALYTRILRQCIWHTFAFSLVILLLPLLLPVFLVVKLYQITIETNIKSTSKGASFMQPLDAMWFQDTEVNPAVICGIFCLNGHVNLQTMQQFIESRFAAKNDDGSYRYPKLVSIPRKIWSRMIWLPSTSFDIKDHVKMYDGELPSNKIEIEAVLSKLSSILMPAGQPAWQMHCIQMKGQQKSVCLIRVHHGIGDGVSLTRMLINEMTDQDLSEALKAVHKPTVSHSQMACIMLSCVFRWPAEVIRLLMMTNDTHALCGQNLSGTKLMAWSDAMELSLIKDMKNKAKCTINDILMSCLAQAFQIYFQRHTSHVPPHVIASVPVNVRQPAPENCYVLDNQFTLVLFPLKLKHTERLSTLAETVSQMRSIKKSPEALLNHWTMSFVQKRMPTALARFIFDDNARKCSMVLSNVPGPQSPLTINHQPVEDALFWPPCRNKIGMGISLLSYNNKVNMGFMVDESIMSNPRVLVELFQQEVYGLAKELGVPNAVESVM